MIYTARPLKDGVDYFPLDTDFLQDDKIRLIKGEFGAKGILIIVALLCEIYRGNGYFKVWDKDCCLLMADAVGGGVVSENIEQVVHGCLRRSFFDEGVFQMFGILTSAGIQRRYLRAVSSRDEITMIKEYWLLNVEDKKDVPASILNKLAFKSVNLQNNQVKKQINPDKKQNNPKSKVKKSKVKQSKGKESIGECARVCASGSDMFNDYNFSHGLQAKIEEWLAYKKERREAYKPIGMKSLLKEIQNNADKFGEAAVIELITSCMASNWMGIIFDRLKKTGASASLKETDLQRRKRVLDEQIRKDQKGDGWNGNGGGSKKIGSLNLELLSGSKN